MIEDSMNLRGIITSFVFRDWLSVGPGEPCDHMFASNFGGSFNWATETDGTHREFKLRRIKATFGPGFGPSR